MATFVAAFARTGDGVGGDELGRGDEDRIELSLNTGEGESSMSALILKHMSSILQPITSRILDLEDKTHRHASVLDLSEQRAEKMLGMLDGHDQRLGSLGAELLRTAEGLQATNANFAEATEKHAQLENDHDVTRTLANRTESVHKGTAASLGDLHRLHETLDNTVRQLQLALSETNIAHLNINDRIADLRNRLEGLNDRHLDAVKSVQEVKQGEENTRQALKRITAAFDKQRKEDQRSFSQLDDRTRNLEAGLMESQHQLESAQKAVKLVKGECTSMKNDLGSLVGVTQQAHAQQDAGRVRSSTDWQGRLIKLEEGVTKLSKATSTERTQTLGVVQALSDGINKNATDIARLHGDLEKVDHRLKLGDARQQKADAAAAELAAQHAKHRESADRAEGELRNMVLATQREAMAKIDAQAQELANTNADLQQANLRADAANTNLNTLHLDMLAASGTISKLSQSVDLAHEYFQGVSKGLHDTTKRVNSGQDGMLPPKGGSSGYQKRTLPPLG